MPSTYYSKTSRTQTRVHNFLYKVIPVFGYSISGESYLGFVFAHECFHCSHTIHKLGRKDDRTIFI